VLVGCRAEVDERIDVGDANTDSDGAPFDALGDFDLIEVAGFPVVDRGPRQAAQVANAGRKRIICGFVE